MSGVRVLGGEVERGDEILTPDALEFVAGLHRDFAATRDELVARRAHRRPLGFLPETRAVRDGDWRVAEAPEPLRDRRVEITGPTERKMTINALNSGAKVWLADLEDANTPHWHNVVSGQVNLCDAARGTIEHTSPEGKRYALRDDVARPAIVVRPRGWHLPERHLEIDGKPAVGALVDFGLHFFHNAELGRPYYYLPKMESHLEARLWNDVFVFAQDELGIAQGTIRATVTGLVVPVTNPFIPADLATLLEDVDAEARHPREAEAHVRRARLVEVLLGELVLADEQLGDGGGVLLGQWLTDGWLWTWIYEMHQLHAFNEERFRSKTWGMFIHAAPGVVMVIVGSGNWPGVAGCFPSCPQGST